MDPADIAIWISLASAAFTLGGLAWQITLYRLSGSRLRVELAPVVLDELGTLSTGPVQGWKYVSKLGESVTRGRAARLDVPLIRIRVVNVGRTATSVSNISLDLTRRDIRLGRVLRPLRHRRETLRGIPLPLRDASTDELVRLEAGESALVYFDTRALKQVNGESRKGYRVRASAHGAARMRASRSPRRHAWRLRRGESLLAQFQEDTPEARAYRAAWYTLYFNEDSRAFVSVVHFVARPILSRGGTLAELKSEVEEALPAQGAFGPFTVSLAVWEAYMGRSATVEELRAQ